MEYINQELIQKVADNLNIKTAQVETVLALLQEGNTVPFIARYRKEVTDALDEEQIRAIEKEYEYGKNLQKRKDDIMRLIDEKGMLTEELKSQINQATKLVDLEDIYRPYKEKKKTKATEAIANGLEPLAKLMMTFPLSGDLIELAQPYLSEAVLTVQDAYQGAKYIIAEQISDNANYRKWIRDYTLRSGKIVTKKKKDAVDEYQTYQNYYLYDEPLKQVKLHRILAINRAEKEKVITVGIDVLVEEIHAYLTNQVIGRKQSIFNQMIE